MKLLKLKYAIATLALFCCLSPKKVKAQVNTQDSLALVDLYNSTNGFNWNNHTNWLTTAPVSTWYGILLYNGKVISIAFNQTDNGNNLTGTILPSFGNLTDLLNLDLDNNHLNDTLPSSLGNLTNLLYLSVSKNNLTGPIPSFLKKFTHLTRLYLGGNNFTGTIPSWLGNLTYLVVLNMWGNRLTGIIPPSFGNLTNLTNLWLFNNQLGGAIPSSFGNLTNLKNLQIGDNQLSDSIPSSLGKLVNLTVLDVDNNQLSGTIPASLSKLTNLQSLYLFGNKLTFAGMEAIVNGATFTNFYWPQATVLLVNNNNTLSVSVGGTPYNNTFKWYQNGNLVATTLGDSTYTPSSIGKYWVVATNAVAAKLTLYSDTINITSLPITLASLTATTNNKTIQTSWHTSTELNTSHFIIQHSTDGSSFTDIGTVKAMGSGANGYQFTDNNPTSGINYYRLKSVDKDGSFAYSKVVSVQFTVNSNQLTVFPNPSKSSITISGNHIVSIQVINDMGSVIKTQTFKDATNPSLSISGLSAGIYHLHVQTTDGKVSIGGIVKE